MINRLSEESKYVVDTFMDNFKEYKDESIALYGVGKNTEILLQNIKDFNIIGLMDPDCIGQVIYGKKVLSYDEVIKNCTKIVIIARKSVVNIIYKRISFLENENKIKIYTIEGEEFGINYKEVFENENISYWNSSIKDLKKSIDDHNVISFDVFDTLIMRKILKTTDIYSIVERTLLEKHNIKINYKEIRIKCEQRLNKNYNAPNFDQIYDEIQNVSKIDNDIKELIKKVEFEVECKYIIPRKSIVEIYNYAISQNKQVYLISDMYLDQVKIKKLLNICGITENINILVSCELNRTKHSGELFNYFKELVKDDSILHIGDNIIADIKMSEKYKIDSFHILSSYDMLINSSYRDILTDIRTTEQKNILGLIISKAFNNPFILNKGRGKFIAKDLKDIGYIFLGPIMLNFMAWIIRELLDSEFKKILFSARDGYLIDILYEIMTEKIEKERIPKGIYFKTSRRAITVATIESEEDIQFILKKPFKCTKEQLLKERFGIEVAKDYSKRSELVVSGEDIITVSKYILAYKDRIIKNASEERKCYIKYINSLGIIEAEKIAIFDFCSSGTIQYYLSKLINKNIQGFYFATMNIPNMFYNNTNKIKSLFGNAKQYHSTYNITKYYMLLESILTDPNNTLMRCGDKDEFIYNYGETKIRKFEKINQCHKGIVEFVEDMIFIDNKIQFRDIDKNFTDQILGLFISNKTIVTHEIINTFYTESSYDFNEEYNVWDSI